MFKKCLHCKKKYKRPTWCSKKVWPTSRYCSRTCKDKYQSIKPSPKKGKHYLHLQGENSYQWKGDNAGYSALHKWIIRYLGQPTVCKFCGKISLRLHWANKSGKYKRDLSDWIRLCSKCHWKHDGKIGKRHSSGTEFKKGQVPWNKGKTKTDFPQLGNSGAKKGNIPWNKTIAT